jgi:hypothetical protein
MSFVGNPSLRDVVKKNFFMVHAGHSTDDVVIDDSLNAIFIAACSKDDAGVSAFEFNWALYNLRKQPPGIGKVTTVTRRFNHDDYLHAAEIAARHMEDKHKTTIDRIVCSLEMRQEFDELAGGIAVGISNYLLRKAALKLRKNRQLKPELIKRVADWGTSVTTRSADDLLANPELVPRLPGVYIFRDGTGYLIYWRGSKSASQDRKAPRPFRPQSPCPLPLGQGNNRIGRRDPLVSRRLEWKDCLLP